MNINRIKKNIKKVEEIVENIGAQDIINRMEIDKENSIEELEQRLEELYRTQQARLEVGADDLDIREEIAEVEEEIKELQDETIEENSIKNERSSIEENIEILEKFKNNKIQRDKLERDVRCGGWKIGDIYKCLELDNAIDNILSDYKKVLKENEELKEKNKTLEELLQGNLYELYKYYRELAGSYQGNCIPIQKLKDKIEELKNISNAEELEDIMNRKNYTISELVQYVLQELLEGRKI